MLPAPSTHRPSSAYTCIFCVPGTDSIHTKLVPCATGFLTAAAWWLFIDTLLVPQSAAPLVAATWTPGLAATLAQFMLSLAPVHSLSSHDMFDSGLADRTRLWVFAAVIVAFGSVLWALWLVTAVYNVPGLPGAAQWPGVAVVIQTGAIVVATLLSFWSRLIAVDRTSMMDAHVI